MRHNWLLDVAMVTPVALKLLLVFYNHSAAVLRRGRVNVSRARGCGGSPRVGMRSSALSWCSSQSEGLFIMQTWR